MGQGRRLLGLVGRASDRSSGVDEESTGGEPGAGPAKEDDEGSDGKDAAVEELHAALDASPRDAARTRRALEDFHDLHASERKGGRS